MNRHDKFRQYSQRYSLTQELTDSQADTCLRVAEYLASSPAALECYESRKSVRSLRKRMRILVTDREIAAQVKEMRKDGVLPSALNPYWWLVLRWIVWPLIERLLFHETDTDETDTPHASVLASADGLPPV